ncbi:UPF0187-domain-containing protein [Trichodelitschia bisporula]|uniref:UPF0187-domain-containing protein n=1 Tax=Trichodelitschia bisporula TaxID=703511 RepID=A0A6G1HJN1_9PEZI|nr:UPF0187-domain-containing protein [Trichodelitschia bisporula]
MPIWRSKSFTSTRTSGWDGASAESGLSPDTREKHMRVGDYFLGPRDVTHFSKVPFFFRLHGSILPQLIVPMTIIAIWSTLVTCILHFGFPHHKYQTSLLTILGVTVSLGLSFRNTTAYEKYNDGRKLWAQLNSVSQHMSRLVWVHVREREGELGKQDLLGKISCINLIAAFSLALKHRLRFEPYVDYHDLRGRVAFLDTFAKHANVGVSTLPVEQPMWRRVGGWLGIPFALENPRRHMKRSTRPLGNLPLEILVHIHGYFDSLYAANAFLLSVMGDILTGTDRILNTPIPLAYSICISQITWLYIGMLPFQLHGEFGWNTIPATLVAGHILMGMAFIGAEIENPFGMDVNDLPLESFCEQIASDLDVIMARPAPKPPSFIEKVDNIPLYPLSTETYVDWMRKTELEIRNALKSKVDMQHHLRRVPNAPSQWSGLDVDQASIHTSPSRSPSFMTLAEQRASMAGQGGIGGGGGGGEGSGRVGNPGPTPSPGAPSVESFKTLRRASTVGAAFARRAETLLAEPRPPTPRRTDTTQDRAALELDVLRSTAESRYTPDGALVPPEMSEVRRRSIVATDASGL